MKRAFVSCIVRSFVSCIVRSYFVSCVRLIKLTNETNDTRNERYTKRTNQLHERSANERTIHANETNEKRKRYEISVNLNDPGSLVVKGTYYIDNCQSKHLGHVKDLEIAEYTYANKNVSFYYCKHKKGKTIIWKHCCRWKCIMQENTLDPYGSCWLFLRIYTWSAFSIILIHFSDITLLFGQWIMYKIKVFWEIIVQLILKAILTKTLFTHVQWKLI